ncbi:MAG TPA: hypothetical protein VM734_20000 [Kofleriaceae bacterium]|nr:hypothetical protein [Kofleriaceae bacterium]
MAGHRSLERVLAASLLVASGCSFVVVRGPPAQRTPGLAPSCTSTPIAPVIDTGLAGLAVVGAVVAHRRLDEPAGGAFPNNDFLRMQRTFSIVGALLEVAAAGYGFVKTAQCRRARAPG